MRKGALHVILLCLLALVLAGSCRSSYGTRKQREVAKMQEERKKETLKQYEDAVKRHKSIQTKETRKRLERNERDAQRKTQGRKTFFLKRWFSKQY
jgi:3-hydroxy-3-methylglutaryl CoA synthase